MRMRISLIALVLALFLLLGGLSFAVDLYFDFLWFQELGKSVVFTTALVAQSILTTATLLVSFVFLFLNLLHANRGPGEIQLGIPTPTGQITAYVVTKQMVRRIAGLAALVVSLFLGLREAQRWETVWRWLNKVDFGISDPIFGRDISFFFFSLPLMEEVVSLGIILCLLAGAGSLILYYFKGALSLGSLARRGHIRVHISLLLALFFLLLSANAYLDRFQVLYSSGGPMFGATYADLHGRLPLLNLLVASALVGAVLLAYNAFAARNVAAVGGIGLYFAAALLGSVYPALLQKFVVAPNELGRESPQIEHNIRATLHAYGLQQVEERNLSGDKALSRQDIQDNAATIQQHPALGPRTAAGRLQPDPGDPHLLRFRLRGQRPVHAERRVAADDAVSARAEFGEPAGAQLDQRAPQLHARLRRDARSRQPGHARRTAGAAGPGHPPARAGTLCWRITGRRSTTGN